MIYTSSYNAWQTRYYANPVSISADRGKDAGFKGDSFIDLAPKREFWRKWKDNRGIIPDEENNRFYVREYYNQVLSHLDPLKIYEALDGSVLLCYESNMEFCHRHIVAEWLESTLNVEILEVTAKDRKLEIVGRPDYILDYLEDVMDIK